MFYSSQHTNNHLQGSKPGLEQAQSPGEQLQGMGDEANPWDVPHFLHTLIPQHPGLAGTLPCATPEI